MQNLLEGVLPYGIAVMIILLICVLIFLLPLYKEVKTHYSVKIDESNADIKFKTEVLMEIKQITSLLTETKTRVTTHGKEIEDNQQHLNNVERKLDNHELRITRLEESSGREKYS